MNAENLSLCERIIHSGYVRQGAQSLQTLEARTRELLTRRQWPEERWTDEEIELLLNQLSRMDSNNFPSNCGAGEREGRVYSNLVKQRYYGMSHGIGRSGDITATQPKAAGSSIISKITNSLVLDMIR